MATYATRPIHPVKRLDGYVFVTNHLKAAEDFKQGAPIIVGVTGAIEQTGADPALIAGFTLASVADYDWKADTFTNVVPSVPVAVANQEFRGTLKGTFAANDVGTAYGVTKQASDIWTLDRAKTAGDSRALVTGVEDGVAVGDIDVPVTFIVLVANRQVIS